jgi:hypothetical protein
MLPIENAGGIFSNPADSCQAGRYVTDELLLGGMANRLVDILKNAAGIFV